MKIIKIILIICLNFVFVFSVYSDKVFLRNGGEIEGLIIEEDEDTVKIKIKGGSSNIPRKMIRKIKYQEMDLSDYLSEYEIYLKKK